MDKLRVAIVGCGQIADGHISEIQKLGNATVVSVCDREPIIAEQLAARFKIGGCYDSFEQMIERERINVLHICTPPATHLQLAKLAVDAGCHVYVEKPLALNYQDSVELVEYVLRAGKKLTIGHNSEFDPPTLELLEHVREGVLGTPVHVESWYGYNLNGSFGKAIMATPDHWVHKLPGKLFHNNINHMLNKILLFLEDDKPEVHAVSWKSEERTRFGDIRDDLHDELRVVLRGSKVSAYGTFSANVQPVNHYLRVYGSKSIIDLDYSSRSVVVDQGAKYPSAIGRLLSGYEKAWRHARSALKNTRKFYHYEYDFFNGMGVLIEKFYESILYDKPMPISTRNILRIAWILDEIFAHTYGEKQ